MRKLISIIIPAYNAASYISETIESIKAQTYQEWELLIVDDGSTDNTKSIVNSYCEIDERIKYIYQVNGRQGKARNNGLAHASGEYIAFIDADDLWLPEKLTTQVEQLETLGVSMVFCNTYIFSEKFTPGAAINDTLPKLGVTVGSFSGDEGLALFLVKNRVPILTVLAKRKAIMEAGGFTENRVLQNAEDYHLWVKMILQGSTLQGLDCTLAAYRKHASSVSDADGLNLPHVVDVKVDLSNLYPDKRKIILASIPNTMLDSLTQVSKYPNAKFYKIIDQYLEILHKNKWKLLFISFQKLGLRRLALRQMYFLLNYLV